MAIGDHCIHYNGRTFLGGANRCAVGIDPVYSYLGNNPFGFLQRAPCFRKNTDAPPCHLQLFLTDEQISEKEKEREEHRNMFREFMPKARLAIIQSGKTNGIVPCPKCLAPLYFSVASNGHVHAHCKTENCLSWME